MVWMCEKITGLAIKVNQRDDLVRTVERMHLRAAIDKLKHVGWEPTISLKQTLTELLA